ncbi:MAG: hypothetical protein AABY33_09770 [Pseudomonadota bacterium]
MWDSEDLITQCRNAKNEFCGIVGSRFEEGHFLSKKIGGLEYFLEEYLRDSAQCFAGNRSEKNYLELFRDNVKNAVAAVNKIDSTFPKGELDNKQIRRASEVIGKITDALKTSLQKQEQFKITIGDNGRIVLPGQISGSEIYR